MSPACHSSIGCIDAHVPVHPAANLYKWAESDAEYVRSLASPGPAGGSAHRRPWQSPAVVDSYSCRQRFLRSYTFSKKETVPEKTVKCFERTKERAADFPCFRHQRKDSGEGFTPFTALRSRKEGKTWSRSKKKGRSLLRFIFYRLLSCTSSFEVADGNSIVHAL